MIITRENLDYLGAMIYTRRKQKHLTQKTLAKATNYNAPGICRIESGVMAPHIDVLADLADALDLEIEIREKSR